MRARHIVEGFPQRLGRLLYEHDITTIELAEQIGVERKSITYWQLGHTCPSAYHLARLAAYFNVSADYLLFGKGET